MALPTSPTILPDHTSLHLVRLEADEQFILAVVATTASEALCRVCRLSAEIAEARLRMVPGKERHKLNKLLTGGIYWRTFQKP